MLSTSFSFAVTFALLVGAEGAPIIPLENTYLELQLDPEKCAQLGHTPTQVGLAMKRFVKDRSSYKLSDLQGVSVPSQITGKTHTVKELGGFDVHFTHIQTRKDDGGPVELGKTERAATGADGDERCDMHLQLHRDKCRQLDLAPEDVVFAVKRFVNDNDSYKLSDVRNVGVTSRKTRKTHKVKELGEIDVQFTRIRPEKRNRSEEEQRR